MEIKCKGGSLRYYECILDTAVMQEETAEVIVPDSLPDVAEILTTDGLSLIRGKEARKSGAAVSGLSELTVLYRTEEGELRRLPVDLPFEAALSAAGAEEDLRVAADVRLSGAEAKLLNSRKLVIRAETCVTASVWTPRELQWVRAVEAEGCRPELKRETHGIFPVTAAEEKTFLAEDVQQLPAGKPPLDRLLYTRAAIHTDDASAVGRKLIVRGTVAIAAVYLDTAGKLAEADFHLPWSAFLDLPDAETEPGFAVCAALTGCAAEQRDNGGISLSAGGVVQALIRTRAEVDGIADAYGTDCELRTVFAKVAMDTAAVQESKTETITIRLDSLRRPRGIIAIFADGGRPRSEGDAVRVPVTVRALCQLEDGETQLLTGRGEAVCAVGGVPLVEITEPYASVTAAGAEIRIPVQFTTVRCERLEWSCMTDAEAGEAAEKAAEPTVTILRAAEGDTVWSLGKHKELPCSAIRAYNDLAEEEEPLPGSLLLLAK